MVPHKGHDLIAETLNLLKDKGEYIFLNIGAFSDVNSQSVIAKQSLNDLIAKYSLQDRYIHISSFLTQEQIYLLLNLSDIIVFPYKKNNESASGAVRNALLTDVPVLVSNEKVFDDIRDYVITLDSIDPKVIAEDILKYIGDRSSEQLMKRKEYISKNHYSDKIKEIINTIYNG
jgi:glycosyltransferase involved in cell wall biosynthesis